MYSRILSVIKITACLLGVVVLKLASIGITLIIACVMIALGLTVVLGVGELTRYVF